MNSIQLIGRLTRDPELRSTTSGKSVCEMRLAVDRPRNRDQVDYVDITAWEKLGELCTEHLEKGRLIAINGRLEYQEWEGDNGKRSRHLVIADSVQFLPSGKRQEADSQASEPAAA